MDPVAGDRRLAIGIFRENAFQRLERTCGRLVEVTQGRGAWEWDENYFAALFVVQSPDEEEVLEVLREAMPLSWDHAAIRVAPERVRRVAGVWGGVMTGQLMFVVDPDDDPMLFAAWWPWGNRLKTSLRVCADARSETVANADPQGRVRDCFGL